MKTFIAFLALCSLAFAGDFATLCADRVAIERVYHAHRIGTKQTFEEAMPREMIEQLARQDQNKETALRKVYGVEITPAILAAEVARITTTTRAPETIAEIKAALGNDPTRFAATMARPIVVERTLRTRFDNDDKLHAPQRREVEKAREVLLAKKTVEGMRDVTWQLAPRPVGEKESGIPAGPVTGVASSGSYSIEATTQLAQVAASPDQGERGKGKLHFEDLDPELQKVLRVQLQKPGDVSAVIETPGGFLVFLAKEKTAEILTAASLNIPKRSYEEWLAQQPK